MNRDRLGFTVIRGGNHLSGSCTGAGRPDIWVGTS